jgi:predicted acylesterase/phospholipase RssA
MKRAFVLCGGGSLGSYEVGVWKYFREVGMNFDIVTGTSIGAINGAFVAANEFDKAVELWKSAAASKVMSNGLNFPRDFLNEFDWKKDRKKLNNFAKSFISHGGADISPFMEWVKEAVPVSEVKTSPITLGVVTTSFPVLKELDVVLNDVKEENILDYLHASSACWPVFPVYSFDKKSYIDGGYFNNLPIDFALRLGADEVVAVLLHAVPRVPQHPELMNLPCVNTIFPSHDTGSIMDFKHNVIINNMTLGYLDACKHFGKYWGYSFAFIPKPEIMPFIKRFDASLATHNIYRYFTITKALELPDVKVKTALDSFIRTLEIMGDWLDLDYLHEYELVEFIKAIQEKVRSKESQEVAKKFYKSRKAWGSRLSKEERAPFLAYIDLEGHKDSFSPSIKRLEAHNPEVSAIVEMISYLKGRSLF